MRFYRGIAVPNDRKLDVITNIRDRGLLADDPGQYRFLVNDLKPRLADLWRLPVVTTADTDNESGMPTWVCAADEMGATYYAIKHNLYRENDTAILICFDADLRRVIIDGRDFLYTVFQFGDPQRARPIAERTYGHKIRQYLDRAWATKDQNQRIALCRPVQDNDVIEAHFKNKIIIGGRFNTRFCSAFMVQTPVPAAHIISANLVERDVPLPEPEVTIPMIRPPSNFVIS